MQTTKPKFKVTYPVFITNKIEETRLFYEKWFGFQTVFNSTWFLVITSSGENPKTLAFLTEDWPEAPKPPRIPRYQKGGAYITFELENVEEFYNSIKSQGLEISYPLTDEPWGQRRFMTEDPSGIHIDIVQQIEPKEGYWDKYVK